MSRQSGDLVHSCSIRMYNIILLSQSVFKCSIVVIIVFVAHECSSGQQVRAHGIRQHCSFNSSTCAVRVATRAHT
jgi:hypothetical protein